MKNKPFLFIFISGIFFSALLFSPFILDRTLVPRFTGLSFCLLLSLFFLFKEKQAFRFSLDIINTTYIAYTFFCCLTVFWANTRSEAIFEACKQVLSLFTFLFAAHLFQHEKKLFLQILLKLSVVLFFVSLGFGISQIIGLGNWDKETLYQIAGVNGHKNLYSSFMFLNFFFLLLAYHKLSGIWRYSALASLILTLLLLVFLRTKAVWVASAVAFFTYCCFYLLLPKIKSTKINIPFIGIVSACVLSMHLFFLFGLQPLIQKGIHPSNSGITSALLKKETFKLEEERLVLWNKTYNLIYKHPLKGVGAGNLQIHLPDATLSGLWRGDELNYTFQRPHNDFLWILAETGFIGFSLFLFFIISIFVLLIRALKYMPADKELRLEVFCCLAALAGFCTIAFFDFPKERMEHTVWIDLFLALAYSLIKSYGQLKYFKVIHPGKSVKYVAYGILFFTLLTGINRLKGEFYTKQMYDAKNSGNISEIIKSAYSAQSYAYAIDPTSIPLSWYIGNAHASKGNYMQAKKEFEKAYALNPYSRHVLNDLGSACVFMNEVARAKTCFEEAARISPRFDEPKLNLAAIYINAGDYASADFWLKSLLHDSERRSNYQKMVDAYLKR